MTALETLIDEVCSTLPLDPIEFRRRNALKAGGRNLVGNPYSVTIRTPEILDKLEKHPIWQQRAQEKARAPAGTLVGTGVACATKNYGSGGDASLATVEIDPDGRITIHCDGAEMGNAIGTAVANRVAVHVGGVADEVAIMQIDAFDPLALVTSGSPYTMDQKTQDAAERDPRWVPNISSATFASIGAHVMTHSAAEAARVVFRFGLWPAALELWGIAPTDPRAKQWQAARWKDGQLIMPGLAAAGIAGGGGKGARAQWRDRGHGALLQSLGVGAGDLRDLRRGMDGRHRCAGPAQGRRQIRSPRSHQCQISAHRIQPARKRVHGAVRHAGPNRDRARDRRAPHRQGLQCPRMRSGAGAGGGAWASAGRLRHGRGLRLARVAAALRGRARQREMESRAIRRRPRVGPAAARPRDRGAAARGCERKAEGHGGGRA